MSTATFNFHAELTDFLSSAVQKNPIVVEFSSHETIKHLIETAGVPHTEVDIVLVNGVSRAFDHHLEPGDRVDIYPVGYLSNEETLHLQPELPEDIRFVLDGHLGKLAAYLRLLGFDTLYQNESEDDVLAEISSVEHRFLLTRDRGLLKRSKVILGYWVRGKDPKIQLANVISRFNLAPKAKPFSRCVHCNGELYPVEKDEINHLLEFKTRRYYDVFHQCKRCMQVYWRGSHFSKMARFIEGILQPEKTN